MRKLFLLAALVALLPLSAQGAVFLTDEDTVNQSGPAEGDVFAASNIVVLNQPITGDVFAAGQRVETTSTVSEDVFAVGNDVSIRGTVGDDVFAAGNTVLIAASQVGDIFAAGNTVTLSEGTVASGDAYLAGATVMIAGTLNGDMRIAAEDITIAETARINGNLTTYGSTQPSIREGAVIAGERIHRMDEGARVPARQDVLLTWLRSVVTWFIIALLVLYALPHVTRNVTAAARERAGLSLLVGVAWLILFLPISIILMVTIIGLPLGFALLLLSGVLLITAYAFAQIILGDFFARRFFTTSSLWQQALLGVVVFKAVQLLPVAGPLVTFILLIWGLGALVLAAWLELRRGRAATVV